MMVSSTLLSAKWRVAHFSPQRIGCSTTSTMIACVDSPHCCSGRVLGVALSRVRYPVWESAAETIGPASTIQGLEPDSLRHAAAAHRLPSLHTDSLLQPTSGSARASHAPEKRFSSAASTRKGSKNFSTKLSKSAQPVLLAEGPIHKWKMVLYIFTEVAVIVGCRTHTVLVGSY